MIYLTFTFEFNAVHRLWSDSFSEDENRAAFGECANAAGHGHLYRIEITVANEVSPNMPVAWSRGATQRLINDVLTPRLQHGDLNTVFGERGFVSTGENVARAIWRLLRTEMDEDMLLVCVKVIETDKSSFVYFGEREFAYAKEIL